MSDIGSTARSVSYVVNESVIVHQEELGEIASAFRMGPHLLDDLSACAVGEVVTFSDGPDGGFPVHVRRVS